MPVQPVAYRVANPPSYDTGRGAELEIKETRERNRVLEDIANELRRELEVVRTRAAVVEEEFRAMRTSRDYWKALAEPLLDEPDGAVALETGAPVIEKRRPGRPRKEG
jgi:hypothetical protein